MVSSLLVEFLSRRQARAFSRHAETFISQLEIAGLRKISVLTEATMPPAHKYGMRFFEFATTKPRKPKKPRKPLTPEQSVVAAHKREVDVAKQALQTVKDRQKERKDAERARRISYAGQLQKG